MSKPDKLMKLITAWEEQELFPALTKAKLVGGLLPAQETWVLKLRRTVRYGLGNSLVDLLRNSTGKELRASLEAIRISTWYKQNRNSNVFSDRGEL